MYVIDSGIRSVIYLWGQLCPGVWACVFPDRHGLEAGVYGEEREREDHLSSDFTGDVWVWGPYFGQCGVWLFSVCDSGWGGGCSGDCPGADAGCGVLADQAGT